jgi:hypothetical protein
MAERHLDFARMTFEGEALNKLQSLYALLVILNAGHTVTQDTINTDLNIFREWYTSNGGKDDRIKELLYQEWTVQNLELNLHAIKQLIKQT